MGSPPQMETMGAMHSSTALRHCWSESFCVMVDSYSRMRPQPVQVRLQVCSGSSINTSGKRLLIIGCGFRGALVWLYTIWNGFAESTTETCVFCHSGLGRNLLRAI